MITTIIKEKIACFCILSLTTNNTIETIKKASIGPLEPELILIEQFCDKTKSSIDIGVFRGVYSYKIAEYSNKVYGFEDFII